MSIQILSSVVSLTADKAVMGVKIVPSAATAASRRAFHLALLLDVSGSMDGERITALKRTLTLLIDAMKADDVLSIITYSTFASVVARAVVISDSTRATLRASVDGLHADGGTNLECALVALKELSDAAGAVPVDAAFILTDGHINAGIQTGSALTRLLGAAVRPGTPVNTLGYGADHNASLLRDMAVRTRGSYTYADAAEVLPAIIADIVSGLDTEIGRDGRLVIPAGWTCVELGAAAGDADYLVGTLIADKPHWVILEGAASQAGAAAPVVEFRWNDGVAARTGTSAQDENIAPLDIHEQICRAHVAVGFAAVTELVESGNVDGAKTKLAELGAELDASPASSRTFVIRLRAQIDEMLEMFRAEAHAPVLGWGAGLAPAPAGLPGAPLQRMPRGGAGWPIGGIPSADPGLAPVLSRMASNTAALGVQRGFVSGGGALAPTFSSPAQRSATSALTQTYSQGGPSSAPAPPTAAPRLSPAPAGPNIFAEILGALAESNTFEAAAATDEE